MSKFFGVAFKFGIPIIKGATKKVQKAFEKEYGELRAAGLSTHSAHKEAQKEVLKRPKKNSGGMIGKKFGPPPKSGPMPQGLASVKKSGR
jgi:hypothetical protein|tara:strand:- start:228 stop:497 length:270 start_codon:yes stop_codon:yes gene_type:complete